MKNVGKGLSEGENGSGASLPLHFVKNQAPLPISKDTCPGGLWVFNKLFLREERWDLVLMEAEL